MTDIDIDQIQLRRAQHEEWLKNMTFMAMPDLKQKINQSSNFLLPTVAGLVSTCVLQSAQDILKVANKIDNPRILVNAGLLKAVFFEEEPDPEEIELALEENELLFKETDSSYIKQTSYYVEDVNQFYPVDEQVHVRQEETERINYLNIPEALTEKALNTSYPVILLISDHNQFDRAGELQVRHTMFLELPPGVLVTQTDEIQYTVQ